MADNRNMAVRRVAAPTNPLSVLELGLVAAVLVVALAVAVPEYVHLRNEAGPDSAKARLTDAARSLASRHRAAGTYAGATVPAGVRLKKATRASYCVETGRGDALWHAGLRTKPSRGGC